MLSIALDSKKEQPLFLQLVRAVGDDIRQGRLKPGDALP
jgi:GntR family transcriptional regulator / MocR family aminotransferase